MEKYRAAVGGICADERVRRMILAYYGLRPSLRAGQVFDELQRWGASQADLALMLVRAGRRREASVLVGRSVPAVCPPALWSVAPRAGSAEEDDLLDRRIARVVPDNPRVPGTDAWHRFRLFVVGRTPRQAMTRGASRRDLRLALKRGWVRLERGRTR